VRREVINEQEGCGRQITIIGGGIIGLCSALELQAAGLRVDLIDPQEEREAASYGNAGIIAVSENQPLSTPAMLRQLPRLLLDPGSPVALRLAHLPAFIPWGWRFFKSARAEQVQHSARALASIIQQAVPSFRQLLADTGGLSRLQQHGWLKVYSTEKGLAGGHREQQAALGSGAVTQALSRADIKQLEPHLAPMAGAVFYPECAQVDDLPRLLKHLTEVFLQRGGRLHQTRALALKMTAQGPEAVITASGTLPCEQLLICAGAWSKRWAKELGCPLPLDTERGYHLMLPRSNNRLLQRPIFWSERAMVLNPMSQGLRLSSGVEFAGLKARPDYAKITRLAGLAAELLPDVDARIEDRWLGFRPSMPDSLPVISRSPKFSNSFFAFGHGHLGLTLGPVTGRLIREIICDQRPSIDVAPFAATRFSSC
jgi:D-amino-acid dehydrogenase